ncbi:MAG: PAS domain S-box protein, partial [Nitrospinae bacterium]|nr:PAS domain S-box protein [Nitrospinota bacterium]
MKDETRFQRILETAVDSMISIDEKGVIELFNPASEKEFGYSPEEVLGKNIKILMPSPYTEKHNIYLENYMRTGNAKIIG